MKLIKDLGMLYPTKQSKRKYRYGIYECKECFSRFTTRIQDKRQKDICSKCSRKNMGFVHGLTGHRIYRIWGSMRHRVQGKNKLDRIMYKDKNIEICDEWSDFIVFFNWSMSNGYKDNLQIDRIDNDKGYNPQNCRWATQSVQNANQRLLNSTNTSGYKGVWFRKDTKKWVAELRINYKKINLGSYVDIIDAVEVRNNYIIENNLPHTLNVIQ